MGFASGADIVTTMGVSTNETIQSVIDAAKSAGKQVMVDMMAVQNVADRVREVMLLEPGYICVHNNIDQKSAVEVDPLPNLRAARAAAGTAQLAAAGGINMQTLPLFIREGADIVILIFSDSN